jgi:acetyltransferase
MSAIHLDRLLHPKSVAVIGASERKGSVGTAVMENLRVSGFSGEIFPVNPNRQSVQGKTTFGSLTEIGRPIDLIVIATPIATASDIVAQGIAAGAGGAVIISAGGKEIGPKGREIEAAIKRRTEGSDFRIIGPNCLGVISSRSRLNASFAGRMPLPGKMAFISQSGAICTSILDLSVQMNIGFSYFISLGSMLDVDFGDMIDYLGGEPGVSSIVMYVESFSRFRNFMSAARSVSRVKPIIALKAGRSRAGARAASSHTGALAGEDAVYSAAFKRAGIVRVKTFEELFDCAELLAKQPRPEKPGLAIITNAGGPGVMAVDALSDYDVEPVSLLPETIENLDRVLSEHWSRGNPVDILGDASPDVFRKAVEICMEAPEVNGVLIMAAPQALADLTEMAAVLAEQLRGNKVPVITSWIGGQAVRAGREIFNRAGIPTFDTPERAVRAFLDLYRYSKNLEMLQEIPPKLPSRMEFARDAAARLIQESLSRGVSLLNEVDAKMLLAAYGIPVTRTEVARSRKEAEQVAEGIGFPVVMKILSNEIVHKSDVGGVRLGLRTRAEVGLSFEQMTASLVGPPPGDRIDGVTLQPMIENIDFELILGSKKDRDFGPVILFGMGGMATEILQDRALALPPLNRLLARRLMEETRVYRLLQGYRNRQPADLDHLEEILIRLSQLVTDFPEIEELDINPMVISGGKAVAVDARVLVGSAPALAPLHMVISPYPNQHESWVSVEGGLDLFVRPIRPEDAPLMTELFQSLSQRSVYFRFFAPLRQFPHSMLARFTQIDYDREIALVAIQEREAEEKMLGVARVIPGHNRKSGEFAVLVGDPWQGKGIGAQLLKRCLALAKKMGLQQVNGIVLAENTHMLALGRKLGFKVRRAPDSTEYDLTIDLGDFDAA